MATLIGLGDEAIGRINEAVWTWMPTWREWSARRIRSAQGAKFLDLPERNP
jgi:hypothetical protein